jgi:pyruvate formate lyase activating enzyme
VHSIDSFTAVDGHGIRAIVFLQGCSKRCLFCCNPDSWDPAGGAAMTTAGSSAGLRVALKDAHWSPLYREPIMCEFVSSSSNWWCCLWCRPSPPLQILKRIKPNVPYYVKSGGGITLSGGECLLQPRFARALCRLAHAHGLTACLDTAASGTPEQW